ncbi:hypothetical protein ACFYO0_19865 [Streptomyces sp. NPDC006365]|uniref:hypothetical protein n=1 Tax=Streptomyces sp. NPDC006365 TaxID=3364744 RepID=UPI0036870409
MNIAVLVEQVPDTGAERTLSQTDHLLDREDADGSTTDTPRLLQLRARAAPR